MSENKNAEIDIHKEYEENPYRIKRHEITQGNQTTWSKNKRMVMMEPSTNSIEGEVVIGARKKVDKEQFMKLYLDGVRQVGELNAQGVKVFSFMWETLMRDAKDSDRIWLSYKDKNAQERMGRTTFSRGITNLKEKGFIANCVQAGYFWINPKFIFNGNRMTMITNYELEDKEGLNPRKYKLKSKEEPEQFTLPSMDENPYGCDD